MGYELSEWLRPFFEPGTPVQAMRLIRRVGVIGSLPSRWGVTLILRTGDLLHIEAAPAWKGRVPIRYLILWNGQKPTLGDIPRRKEIPDACSQTSAWPRSLRKGVA